MKTSALGELLQALRQWRLWMLLGWLEIRQKYARSLMGPFWITLSMGVMVGSIGLVYGNLFDQKMSEYLPLVGNGFVIWALISGTLGESCSAYINNANYIKQSDVVLWIYTLQGVWRQFVMLLHNIIITLILMTVFGVHTRLCVLWFIPGLIVVVLNIVWIAQILAIISARYRDVPQLVASVLQLLFYVTPLMWKPAMLKKAQWLITYNPFASLVDLLRSPLLGDAPDLQSWEVAVVMLPLGWALALWLYARKKNDVAYWV